MDFRLYIWPRKSRDRAKPEYFPRCVFEWADQKFSLSSHEATLMAGLAKGQIVSTDSFIDALYGDDEDGGPLCARRVVHVKICHLRKKLANTPFRIIRNGIAGYRLITTTLDSIADEVLDE